MDITVFTSVPFMMAIIPPAALLFSLFINMVYKFTARKTHFIYTYVCSDVFLKQNPFFCMWELGPFQISAQMITILPFKKVTVNTEQSSQKLTADRKRIDITLLKKTLIPASSAALSNQFPVTAYIAVPSFKTHRWRRMFRNIFLPRIEKSCTVIGP